MQWLRSQPSQQALVRACYFDDPLMEAVKRYHAEDEWQAVRRWLPPVPGKVLDVGAGRGIASYALATDGWQVTALEPDPSPLVGAGAIRTVAAKTGLPIVVVEEFGEKLPFPNASFDLVHARQVLHHARNLEAFCQELVRVLKPGGLFIATREHVIDDEQSLHQFLDRHPLHKLYGGENAFTLDQYLGALRNAGLQLRHVLTPLETPINTFPQTRAEILSKAADVLGISPGMVTEKALKRAGRLLKDPGRLFSFIGVRPGIGAESAPPAQQIEEEGASKFHDLKISMKPRIMQVIGCYSNYLQKFYAERPDLSSADEATQLKHLLSDGYGAVHTLVPELLAAGYDAEIVYSNCIQTQSAWAREHGLQPPQGPDWEKNLLRQRIEISRPDVLYILDSITFDATFLRSISYRPKLTLGWRSADVPLGTDWTGYDVILSGLPSMLALAPSLGCKKSVWFVPGMPGWIARAVEEIEQDTDVVFVGSISPTQHIKRQQLLDVLANAANEHGFSLNLHLIGDPKLITPAMRQYLRPPVFGLAMHNALRRGKIVFDVQGTIGLRRSDGTYAIDLTRGDTANMRLFEGTGGGSLVLTEALPGLSKLFEPKHEIATFSTAQEMIEQILFYLSHKEARIKIANAGKIRCLNQWNMKKCASAFMDIIKEYF